MVMIISMLRQFLRNTTLLSVAAPLLFVTTFAISVDVSAAVTISSASWSDKKKRLEIKGTADASNVLVTVTNFATGAFVADDETNKRGSWKISIRNPASIPCRVRANQPDGSSDDMVVSNAPADCDNGTPPVNNAPVCVIDAPAGNVTINVGDTVSYNATVTDADNNPLTISWNFNGGTPASSNAEDPGNISYGSAGTFTTSLTASDGHASCTEQTRTITVQDIVPPAPNVSINSTSQNSTDVGVVPNDLGQVPEQPFVGNISHRIMAINDLGMHCGDFDTRIASILPPFQVLLAQVVERGNTPRLLDNIEAEVVYSAVSNSNDPILNNPNVFTGVAPDGSVFKTNFWDIASQAYDPFYPQGILGTVNIDTGLPVPNVEDLFIGPDGILNNGDEHLTAVTHAMPGMTAPYLGNTPHVAEEFYNDKPFFAGFPFGYVAENLSWFEGAGIPFTAYDDFGREAPYPLVRVQANVDGATVATTDTVLPISGEASCKNCHSADVGITPNTPHAGAALVNLTDTASEMDDPAMGNVPVNVSVEYATDLNILKLHDQKHGTLLINGTTADFPVAGMTAFEPVVCQRCHYTPALDLAQLGPLGPEHEVPLVINGVEVSPSLANGRTQLSQSTMSNVMHSHHGSTGLFPDIPAPIQNADGTVTNQADRVAAMEASCYQCHPGTDTQCLRGAMFNGDMLCSDCHGSMQQVGADFSQEVTPGNSGLDKFIFTGNFYDPDDPQPRVPWANEPGCGACHTGDVLNNAFTQDGSSANVDVSLSDVIVNTRDMDGNVDGIRLRQSFRISDNASNNGKATPIVPSNNRFAENIVPASFNGTPNPG
ncbi:MAG: PKD domain-containing protein, partial [Gammaproteobacteria bacterium]|nr:PKD domain-containing protein [Gammaproteobacteria bacterium]